MAISHGMDVVRVRGLAKRLDNEAGEVEKVVNAVDKIITEMREAWVGPDATAFEGWWREQHRPALQKLKGHLSGLAQSARNNASAQEEVSRG